MDGKVGSFEATGHRPIALPTPILDTKGAAAPRPQRALGQNRFQTYGGRDLSSRGISKDHRTGWRPHVRFCTPCVLCGAAPGLPAKRGRTCASPGRAVTSRYYSWRTRFGETFWARCVWARRRAHRYSGKAIPTGWAAADIQGWHSWPGGSATSQEPRNDVPCEHAARLHHTRNPTPRSDCPEIRFTP